MDALIIYLIIGAIWLFQVLTKKKLESQRRQGPEKYEPPKERDIFDELKEVLEKKYQPPSDPEVVLKKAEPVEEQQIEGEEQEIEGTQEGYEEIPAAEIEMPVLSQPQSPLIQPQIESRPALYLLSNLSGDVLEQGIILSTILGPPRSVQIFKGLAGRNLRWLN